MYLCVLAGSVCKSTKRASEKVRMRVAPGNFAGIDALVSEEKSMAREEIRGCAFER